LVWFCKNDGKRLGRMKENKNESSTATFGCANAGVDAGGVGI
jgi:hypothetical protein